MANQSRTHAKGKTKSGLVSRILTAYANRLVLQSALDSRGALGRTFKVPFIRAIAAFLAWWSRGWLGQALGWKWSTAAFKRGFSNRLDPAEIGDAWAAFKDGIGKR